MATPELQQSSAGELPRPAFPKASFSAEAECPWNRVLCLPLLSVLPEWSRSNFSRGLCLPVMKAISRMAGQMHMERFATAGRFSHGSAAC